MKIPALLMVGLEGPRPDARARQVVSDPAVAGVILFGRNILSPPQLRELLGELTEERRRRGLPLLLVAVDQEGGTVTRIRRGATSFPGNRVLGEGGSEREAYQQGLATGQELATLGVNLNLAPVLDLYTIPGNPSTSIRSFGPDPERAALLGAALIRGLEEGGVAATAKHFPGKGAARIDSHLALPRILRTREQLAGRELVPFRRAVAAGVSAMMISHAAYPALEDGKILPATFSRNVQKHWLRDELGFSGIIITDDLGMGAIGSSWGAGEAAVAALSAGADLLLLCHERGQQEEARRTLTAAAADQPKLAQAAAAAGKRLDALRQDLADRPTASRSRSARRLAGNLAERALRIVSDPGGLIPLDPVKPVTAFQFGEGGSTGAEERDPLDAGGLSSFLEKLGYQVSRVDLPADPTPTQINQALSRRGPKDTVICCTLDAYRFGGQRRMIARLGSSGVIGAALKDPRDSVLFPRGWTALLTYSPVGVSLEALALLLAGGIRKAE